MMLLVLDENPTEAALKIPTKIRHKQLLELMQMLSCVVDFGYKQIPQAKEMKEWIARHKAWVYSFAKVLMHDLNLKEETRIKYNCLLNLIKDDTQVVVPNLKTAIFRYSSEYQNTNYPSNSELSIDVAIAEYEKYVDWKGEKWQ